MIQGFEQQTQPLTDYERDTLLPLIRWGLSTKQGKEKSIAGSTIIEKMRAQGYKLDGPRLRKIINHIRANDMIAGLVSTSKGYYVASTAQEIDDYINSLHGRVEAIKEVIRALSRQRQIKY
jgi:hypothetical protein